MLPPAANALSMELQGNQFRVEKDGAVAYHGTFAIQGATAPSPSSITLTYTTSAQPLFLGGPRPGVFQIEGDTLKMCLAPIGHPRPTAVTTFPGSEAILSIFQRHPERAQVAAAQQKSLLRSMMAW